MQHQFHFDCAGNMPDVIVSFVGLTCSLDNELDSYSYRDMEMDRTEPFAKGSWFQ